MEFARFVASGRLAQPENELVCLSANRRVEDVGGARVIGAAVEIAFGLDGEMLALAIVSIQRVSFMSGAQIFP